MSRRPDTGARAVAAGTGVNLLPSSVHAAKDLRRLRARLALVLVLVVAVVTGGYGYLLTRASGAQDQLTAAEAETARLETERVQYHEVEEVRADHLRAQQARTVGMGPEIRWTEMLARIEAVIAADTFIQSFSGEGPSAVDGIGRALGDPLAPGGVGSITFSIRTPTLPGTAAWLDSLNGIGGFRSGWFSSATLNEEDGTTSYTVASTVQLDLDALSQAFVELPDETAPEDTQEVAG